MFSPLPQKAFPTQFAVTGILVLLCAFSASPIYAQGKNRHSRAGSETPSLADQFARAYQQSWDKPASIVANEVQSQPSRSVGRSQRVNATPTQNNEIRFTNLPVQTHSYNQQVETLLPQPTLPVGRESGYPLDELPRIQAELNSLGAPHTFENTWWKGVVALPFDEQNSTESVDIDSLLFSALQNSQQIQFISKDPLVRELEIVEADAEFDPALFARSVYDDRVDPVGNSLTTGGAPFLEDNIWSAETGVRRKLRTGGQLELEQSLGFQNSNSRFFVPQDQGTATLSLNFNQPLLRGAGRTFNRSQILLAQTSTDLAWDTFSSKLQDELLAVVEAYWELYFRRAVFLQKQKNVTRGSEILKKIEGRVGLDSLPSQVARARSEVQSRRTELANAFRDVRNAETEIRRLLSDPNWLAKQSVEMLPAEAPVPNIGEIELKNIVYTALQNRPEIRATVQKAKLAGIQTNILTNELLPELTLLFSSYVSALEGDTGVELAWQRQFSADPGFSVGLEFEVPYQNRAARSRHTRSKIQLSKINHEIQQTTQNVIAEAQVAYRRVMSAFETLQAAELAVEASRIDLRQNQKRWENFALIEGDIAEGQTPTLVLDQLLDSQQRLADSELTYSQSMRELKVSEVALRRATGTLLQAKEVEINKEFSGDQPTLRINRR